MAESAVPDRETTGSVAVDDARTGELVALLEARFPDGPPSDQTVRQQSFTWSSAQWQKRWSRTLAQPVELVEADARPTISRQDVFDRARDVSTEADAVALFLLVAAWGTGTRARSIARVAPVLQQPDAPSRLLSSYRFAREGQPDVAYQRLYSYNHYRIKQFGPAFFTKWLYFSAFEEWDPDRGPAPLILDARVAATLGWRSTGWSARSYHQYLAVAAAVRDKWAPAAPLHVVEYAMFARP